MRCEPHWPECIRSTKGENKMQKKANLNNIIIIKFACRLLYLAAAVRLNERFHHSLAMDILGYRWASLMDPYYRIHTIHIVKDGEELNFACRSWHKMHRRLLLSVNNNNNNNIHRINGMQIRILWLREWKKKNKKKKNSLQLRALISFVWMRLLSLVYFFHAAAPCKRFILCCACVRLSWLAKTSKPQLLQCSYCIFTTFLQFSMYL